MTNVFVMMMQGKQINLLYCQLKQQTYYVKRQNVSFIKMILFLIKDQENMRFIHAYLSVILNLVFETSIWT